MASLFDAHQRSTLEAATGRIIPADRDPGALEAGVIDYIENALAGYDAEHAPLYVDGIKELDKLAREKFSAEAFIQLSADQQDQRRCQTFNYLILLFRLAIVLASSQYFCLGRIPEPVVLSVALLPSSR